MYMYDQLRSLIRIFLFCFILLLKFFRLLEKSVSRFPVFTPPGENRNNFFGMPANAPMLFLAKDPFLF